MRRNKWISIAVLVFAIGLLSACSATVPTPAPKAEAMPPALVVKGKVTQELSLTMEDLEGYGVVQITVEHPKNGPTEYKGVRLTDLLNQAGIQDGATTLLLTADDDYSAQAAIVDVQTCADCLIAFQDSGGLQAVMPGMSSKTWVKGLISIEAQ